MSIVVTRETVLVRYGVIPEVARFRIATAESLRREQPVVVQTHRGVELGTLLQDVDDRWERLNKTDVSDGELHLIRAATPDDRNRFAQSRRDCEADFDKWCSRITEWNLKLQLVDLEWMLDRKKLVLYVLNERGPDCTKLALQAAAGGLGLIEVQPVDADGLVQLESGGSGGCGSGGCGSGCH